MEVPIHLNRGSNIDSQTLCDRDPPERYPEFSEIPSLGRLQTQKLEKSQTPGGRPSSRRPANSSPRQLSNVGAYTKDWSKVLGIYGGYSRSNDDSNK